MNSYERVIDLFRRKKISPEELNYYKKSIEDIELFENLKLTQGWQELEKRIKEELREEIRLAVKDNKKISTLLSVLAQVDTKSAKELLEEEINNVIN